VDVRVARRGLGAGGVVVLRDAITGKARELDVTGLFIAIGHDPRSELFKGQLDLDDNGYIKAAAPSTRTNIPGVFAAGDVVDHTPTARPSQPRPTTAGPRSTPSGTWRLSATLPRRRPNPSRRWRKPAAVLPAAMEGGAAGPHGVEPAAGC
jgi:hypothetical protein